LAGESISEQGWVKGGYPTKLTIATRYSPAAGQKGAASLTYAPLIRRVTNLWEVNAPQHTRQQLHEAGAGTHGHDAVDELFLDEFMEFRHQILVDVNLNRHLGDVWRNDWLLAGRASGVGAVDIFLTIFEAKTKS